MNTYGFTKMYHDQQRRLQESMVSQEKSESAFTGNSPVSLTQRLNAIRGRVMGHNHAPSRDAPVHTRQGRGGSTPVLSQDSGATTQQATDVQQRLTNTFVSPIQAQQRPSNNISPYNLGTFGGPYAQ